MPAGADVSEALHRGSDEGGTLVVGGGGGGGFQKKKRANEQHGREGRRHSARGRAGGSRDWSRVSSRPQEPEDTQKPPVSVPPCPPGATAAVVSRGLSSSAPSALLSGWRWEAAAPSSQLPKQKSEQRCGAVSRVGKLCSVLLRGAWPLLRLVSGTDEPERCTRLLDVPMLLSGESRVALPSEWPRDEIPAR